MSETTWEMLRAFLADQYPAFLKRLTRSLGSKDLASETLHETWLHLHRAGSAGSVHRPSDYLMRVAINVAMDQRRTTIRRAEKHEVLDALEVTDPAPGPGRQAEARQSYRTLKRAIAELPERTRAIFIAARLDGVPHHVIAERYGISRRMVLHELKRAMRHCEARLSGEGLGDPSE